jgi:hypothetical protein
MSFTYDLFRAAPPIGNANGLNCNEGKIRKRREPCDGFKLVEEAVPL